MALAMACLETGRRLSSIEGVLSLALLVEAS